jgi:hypothetical protein
MRVGAVVFGSMLLTAFAVDLTGSRWPGVAWLVFLGVLLALAIYNYRQEQSQKQARALGNRREAAALAYADADDPAALIDSTIERARIHVRQAKEANVGLGSSVSAHTWLSSLQSDLDGFDRPAPPSVDRLASALELLQRARGLNADASNPNRKGRTALGFVIGALFGNGS